MPIEPYRPGYKLSLQDMDKDICLMLAAAQHSNLEAVLYFLPQDEFQFAG
jgi:hypothetical protein